MRLGLRVGRRFRNTNSVVHEHARFYFFTLAFLMRMSGSSEAYVDKLITIVRIRI